MESFFQLLLRVTPMMTAAIGICFAANALKIGLLDFNILSEEERTVDVAWPSDAASDILIDSLFIPATVEIKGNTYTVTEIREDGFRRCKNIEKFISIPGSVKKIGWAAFSGLEKVEFIELNEGLESIGHNAFKHSRIKTVRIPRSVLEIKYNVWSDCTDLTDVEWPDHLTTIPNSCFDGCSSLKPWNFSNITEIESWGFSGCSSFENVVIPAGCEVEMGGLWGYEGKHLTFEPGPTVLKDLALLKAELTHLELPEGITLGVSVLGDCNNLRSLTINPGTHLEHRAFWEYQWKNWNPEGETLWEGKNLLALDSVIYLADVPEVMDAEVFTPNVYQKAVLYVKPEALEKARTTVPWSRFKHISSIQSGVSDILSDEDSDTPISSVKDIFSLEGLPCGNNTDKLPPGTYIIRSKNGTRKIHINNL